MQLKGDLQNFDYVKNVNGLTKKVPNPKYKPEAR